MPSRATATVLLVVIGLAGGPLLLRLAPGGAQGVPVAGCLLAFAAGAIGLPLLLVQLGASGRYATAVRLWPLAGALAVLLLAAGVSAAVVAAVAASGLGGGRVPPSALLALAAGAGLFTGLGGVKLALRKGRSGR